MLNQVYFLFIVSIFMSKGANMQSAFVEGFGVGGGLIMAIGAQNAFVLTQGVRRNYQYLVASICTLCDIVLIGFGVAGVGATVNMHPEVAQWIGWAGSIFLFWYGLRALRSALRGGHLEMENSISLSRTRVVAATLAVTLLNPHVYLDTMLFLGGISTQFEGQGRYIFGLGAMSASVIWFFSLSFGGRFLAPFFRRAVTWRLLDLFVCLIMWGIGAIMIYRLLLL